MRGRAADLQVNGTRLLGLANPKDSAVRLVVEGMRPLVLSFATAASWGLAVTRAKEAAALRRAARQATDAATAARVALQALPLPHWPPATRLLHTH